MRDYKSAGRLGGFAAAKSAAERKLERIRIYNLHPKLCKSCSEIIAYDKRMNDFCNHSCSALFNNKGIRRHGQAPVKCLNCGLKTSNEKFCCHVCMLSFKWAETKANLLTLGIDNSAGNLIGKKYLIELHNGKCQVCGLNKWQGQPMPLVLDHIDGNPYNDALLNLRVICNNCDSISPTFKGRNKGNGRFKRAERYKFEKEVVGNMNEFKWKR